MLYLSHSVSPVELGQVYALAQRLKGQGGRTVIAHRGWNPAGPLPPDLAAFLSEADALVFFLSQSGRLLPWVNREYQLASGKPAIALVEHGVGVKGLPPDRTISFQSGMDINNGVTRAASLIQALHTEKQTRDALAVLVVGGLILLALGSLGGDKR